MARQLKYSEAILEATAQSMERDHKVYLLGLGVNDPKGVFGTTKGLLEKFGHKRIWDMPTSENAMTGIAIGLSLIGCRPLVVHQRVDFSLLAMDQIINNAAKWHYTFGGQMKVPLVIRLVIGRGWGQGPQHSQSLQALFAHIPGLKIVMPATSYDAKGLLIAAIEEDNPVIYLEHRWLHPLLGEVPKSIYSVPIGKAKTLRSGKDLTIVATSYMTIEALRAANFLNRLGVDAEVIDVRTLKPLDKEHLLESIQKTGRLIVADADWKTLGFGAEVLSLAAEEALGALKHPPRRVCLPDAPTPSSWALSNHYYPTALDIVQAAQEILGLAKEERIELEIHANKPADVPDLNFTGPF